MTVVQLLAEAAGRGLQMRRQGDEIVIRGDQARIDSAFLHEIRRCKPMLLPVLRSEQDQPWLSRREITPDMLPLVALRQDELDALLTQVPGGPPNVQDIYPLASSQEGLLFHHLLDPKTDPYVLARTFAFRSRERLDQAISALQDTVNRHDILRTSFFWEGLAEPLQVVSHRAYIAVEPIDLPANCDAVVELRDRSRQPEHRLDPRHAPLLRAFVAYDSRQDRWYLRIVEHHLIGDHSSFEVLAKEFEMHLLGSAHRLPAAQPFRDFVARSRLHADHAADDAFFQSMLGDVEEPTAPFGLLEVRGSGHGIAEGSLQLHPDLSQSLRALARLHKVSVASLCHLAWGLVLACAADQDTVVFGTVLFGRMEGGDDERAIGPFINSLPIRVDITGTVLSALRRTHALLTELMMHEHASLARAQRCSAVPATMPLFSSIFNYRHTAASGMPTNSMLDEIEWLSTEESTSYAFDLSVDDCGDIFELVAQVDARVNPERVCQMMEQALKSLVDALAHDPHTPLESMDLLSNDDRRLIEQWNDTALDLPSVRCLHEFIEEQVARTPHAPALTFEGHSLSYAQLDDDANRLARHLIDLGVSEEDRVVICAERSFATVTALLAIHKAGAAYVPVSPADPQERLRLTLDDAQPALVITQSGIAGRFNEFPLPCLVLNEPEIPWRRCSSSPPDIRTRPEGAACVLYTSGSTGRPKGVVLEHRSLVNRIQLMRSQFGLSAQDVILHKSALTVDVAAWEIFAPLFFGARIVLARHHGEADASYLAKTVCDEKVTMVDFVPAVLSPFLDVLSAKTELRHVFCGGEVMPADVPRQFRLKCPGAVLHNMYGPTEVTIDATVWSYPPEAAEVARVPVGCPLPNARIYIVDRHGRQVPIGVSGEILVGGAGVARGYLNQPELTAERFRPDPFCRDPDARVYRTGDLGRWRSDGMIEFQGRNDFQIKIRGLRIEPGEIEARLADHPGIREAVVMMRQDEPGQPRLVAYIVAQSGGPKLRAGDLHQRLSAAFPPHMVPTAYVVLAEFPLTRNGKLDRRALPVPGVEALAMHEFEQPRGATEMLVASLWQDLLKVKAVGRQDNFFNLGGNSLLAITLIERFRQHGFKTDIRSLFAATNLIQMAEALEIGRLIEIPPSLIPQDSQHITPEMLPLVQLSQHQIDAILSHVPSGARNVQDIYPLVPLQRGILFHFLLGEQADPYLSFAILRLGNRDEMNQCLNALQSVVDRHDILRTAIFWEGLSEPVQLVQRKARLPVYELSLPPEREPIAELTRLATSPEHRLELRQAPLLRVLAAQDPARGDWLLLLQEHHLIGDHTSFDLLAKEVQAHLLAREAELHAPQPFRSFAARTRLGLDQSAHEKFFRGLLKDIDGPTAPFGQLHVYSDGRDIREHSAELPQALSERLRSLSRDFGISLASLCHLAWALVVAASTDRQQVVFGTVLFGRLNGGEAADRVMGPFINSLPVRVDIDETSVLKTAQETQRLLIELLVHEHASLALAQRCSAVPPGQPLFSSLFNFRHVEQAINAKRTDLPFAMQWIQSSERTNYPVGLSVDERGDSLGLVAHVVPPLNPVQVCSLMEHALTELARALEDNPETPVAALDILPAAERAQVLYGFNDTAAPVPDGLCVHDLIARQAAASPQAVALLLDGVTLSYGELNARANRLAHYLVERGAGPGDRIGLCAERSFEMIVGLLAILKAGAAYVPLDPAYPSARLAHMIADSAPVLLLAQGSGLQALDEALAGNVIAGNDAPVRIDLLADAGLWADQPATDPVSPDLTPHSLAYVIYTSGSTGRPKGVMIEHMGLANLVMAQIAALDLAPQSRVLQFASIGFDASVSEIFATLCAGACLHLLPSGGSRDIAALQRRLAEEEISHVTLPSAVLATFDPAETLPRLKTLIVAGDALPPALANRWRRGRRLLNAYGPTETTVCATIHPCRHDHDGHVPIGRPIANTRIYILDERMRPVPVGVAGRLWIGGIGLARGYLNQPELTAERFRPDPFLSDPQARIYDSGDLGRWMPDGTIAYLGRSDFQLKIRGFRIEPGEIEARLCDHSQVREAVVIAREDQPGDRRLAAYVVPAAGVAPEAKALRAHLAQTLPEHMVPAAYVVLDRLPLTPNGKLDRNALPAPDLGAFGTPTFEPPSGETEQKIAAIWQELLGVERVGRFDNFFNLGGNSLLAVSLLARIQDQFAVTIDLVDIFSMSGLSDIAEAVVISQLKQFQSDELADALDDLDSSDG